MFFARNNRPAPPRVGRSDLSPSVSLLKAPGRVLAQSRTVLHVAVVCYLIEVLDRLAGQMEEESEREGDQ